MCSPGKENIEHAGKLHRRVGEPDPMLLSGPKNRRHALNSAPARRCVWIQANRSHASLDVMIRGDIYESYVDKNERYLLSLFRFTCEVPCFDSYLGYPTKK